MVRPASIFLLQINKYIPYLLASEIYFNNNDSRRKRETRYSYKEEIESWTNFGDILSSKEKDRELFKDMLNDCYKYAAAINAKGQIISSRTVDYGLVISFTTQND